MGMTGHKLSRGGVGGQVACNVACNVNVFSLGLSNATEEQQVYSAMWDMPMLQGVCTMGEQGDVEYGVEVVTGRAGRQG